MQRVRAWKEVERLATELIDRIDDSHPFFARTLVLRSVAVRRLGSSLASFVSLTEVIFAVTFAFVLLGQRPGPMQLVGGGLILAGIALVQRPAQR